ncbi:ketoacyl-ACP synthase III [Flavobacterium paronense]|uniref:Ketoacyl-ACP synthase III n=1 Tax=Flavobacterium paronense TaxID=1392775 RepID=A0ABV5GAN9_9FLAO|nr:ketoacyl-ACP synthase III [Flavobacterium paronense]MDN3676688.1 ketoacyl-ACP synthase III [Flavobacterium paronense]
MAFQKIKNVKIAGISACVPENIVDNASSKIIGDANEIQKFIDATGIAKRHTVGNSKICTSDLCFQAAEKLIEDLQWSKQDIDCLIFVTQTPDYILPATSCILQHRLGLTTDCFAIDISLGCSGWVYGLATISQLVSSGNFKKGLLLVGDTVTVTKSELDKSTFPLFGDAGTATALEFNENAPELFFQTSTDGSGYQSIIIEDGGFRNFFTKESLEVKEREEGVFRNNLQSYLNGADVFIFGITKAPKSINSLIEKFNIDREEVDYLIMHQANKLMNDKIRKKVNIDTEKVPYSFDEYGNTSSASIPLTIVSRLNEKVSNSSNKFIACGFGVGLSWGSVYFETDTIICPKVITYNSNN